MDDSTLICRCEEVTYGDVKKALEAGLVTPADVRKYTRAGMGSCQGRTCQRLMLHMIRQYVQSEVIAEESITPRAPAGQVSLKELANWDEEV